MDSEAELRSWVEAGDRVQAEAFAHLAEPVRGGGVRRVDHGILFSTGIPSRTLNGFSVTKRPSNPAAVISEAQAFGVSLGVGWSISGREKIMQGMRPALEKAGFRYIESEPGMILTALEETAPDAPPGFVVERVRDLKGIRNCFLTMAAGYDIPAAALAPLLRTPVLRAYLADTALNFHVGYFGGRPVACSVGLAMERVAYVFIVSTIPSFRRRGFGEALTWSAVHAGRERGCVTSYLRSTEMGRPIYEKMGYREVDRHMTYAKSTLRGLGKARLILRFVGWAIKVKVAGPRVTRRETHGG